VNPELAPPRTDLPYLRHRRRAAAVSRLVPLVLHEPAPAPATRRTAPVRRATAEQPQTLSPQLPTTVLTRLQAGVGMLTVTARWGAAGAAGLFVAYRRSTGENRLLSPLDGPYLQADNVRLDHRPAAPVLTVDLLHIRTVDRLLIGCLPAAGPVTGALIITTHGGSRVDLPVSAGGRPPVAVLMTAYNVDGELVLRAEQDAVDGTLQAACLAYGYDRFTWLDPQTPVR
jgi:hypothetical protein